VKAVFKAYKNGKYYLSVVETDELHNLAIDLFIDNGFDISKATIDDWVYYLDSKDSNIYCLHITSEDTLIHINKFINANQHSRV